MEESRNVLLLGSSRVGKTSLLASVIHSAIDFFGQFSAEGRDGLDLTMEPDDAKRVDSCIAALRGGLANGAFDADCVAATTGPSTLSVKLGRRHRGLVARVLGKDTGVNLCFHDYPGALINDLPTMTRSVLPLSRADAVIVPIDAALLMEAQTAAQEVAALALHRMAQMEALAIEWVKGRARNESGLILFVPMKCESYLGNEEAEKRLLNLVCHKYFTMLLDIVGAFGQNILGMYMPVSTVGCCRLTGREWVTGDNPSFRASYGVNGEAALQPFGCEIVILTLAEYFLKVWHHSNAGHKVVGGLSFGAAGEMITEIERLVDICREKHGYTRYLRVC